MKKILLILSISIFAAGLQSIAQISYTSSKMNKLDANAFLLKSKKQKTAAWILLAGGTSLFMVGESVILKEDTEELGNNLGAAFVGLFTLGYGYTDPAPVKRSSIAPVMEYSGLGALLGSIPLFIAAHKNKVQAKLFIKKSNPFICSC